MGNIAAERDEILKLITNISRGDAGPRATAISGSNLAQRRDDLQRLRQVRQRLQNRLTGDDIALGGAATRAGAPAATGELATVEELPRDPSPHNAPLRLAPTGPQAHSDLAALCLRLEARVSSIEERLEGGAAAAALPAKAAGAPDKYTLSGAVREGLLADVLQLLSSNEMSGCLRIVEGDTTIDLFYREGEVFHASDSAGDLIGESAFFAAMALDSGRFFFDEQRELPEESTIQGQTQFLILEALRQIDESRANQK